MYHYQQFFLLILMAILGGCVEKITDPVEINLEEKPLFNETYFDLASFEQRRINLMNKLPNDALVIVTTNELFLRNGDVNFDFRPASTFYYLTGFDEPNAIAVIKKNQLNIHKPELIMFVEERSESTRKWLGPVYGLKGAVEYFNADSAHVITGFSGKIQSYLTQGFYKTVFANFDTNPKVAELFYNAMETSIDVYAVDNYANSLRSIKSPVEISGIQKAVEVTVEAFTEVLKVIEPGKDEYELGAIFDYVFGLNGCSGSAFPAIVASGPNINIVHYQKNQRKMEDGELVMIDAGAEYAYYASDITRTIPVNGKYTRQQAIIYEIVREAHKKVIETAAPGISYYDLYGLARDIALDGLLKNGIITGDKAEIISSNRFRQYIPAGLGHSVGLDVHDPFPREENGNMILQENMVFAFEPHIYLYEGDSTVDPNFWNVSVRIEDVVLITNNGNEILSKNLPVEIDEIENLMR